MTIVFKTLVKTRDLIIFTYKYIDSPFFLRETQYSRKKEESPLKNLVHLFYRTKVSKRLILRIGLDKTTRIF